MPRKASKHPGVSVQQRGKNQLVARWRDPLTNREMSASLDFRSKTEALPWLVAKSSEIREAKDTRRRMRVRAVLQKPFEGLSESPSERGLVQQYKAHLVASRGEGSAHREVEDQLKPFRAWLSSAGVTSTTALSAFMLFDFHDHLCAVGGAASSINRRLNTTKAFLNWARKRGYLVLSSDDIRDALPSVREAKKLPRTLSPDEVKALLRAVMENDRERFRSDRGDQFKRIEPDGPQRMAFMMPFVLLTLLSGMRQGECWALRHDSVHLDVEEIHVLKSKTEMQRAVPLHDSPALVKLLHVLGGADSDFVLGGVRERVSLRVWKRILQAAGLPPTKVNDLRKTCVSAVVSGMPAFNESLLAARFGHGKDVSELHYRRAQHRAREWGDTVEAWLGAEAEIHEAIEHVRAELARRGGFD